MLKWRKSSFTKGLKYCVEIMRVVEEDANVAEV